MSVCCGTNVYFAFICFLSGLLFVIVWFDQGLIHTLNRSEKSSYKLNVYLFFFFFFLFFFLQRMASFIFAPDLPLVSWTDWDLNWDQGWYTKWRTTKSVESASVRKHFTWDKKEGLVHYSLGLKVITFSSWKLVWRLIYLRIFSEKRTRTSCARNERSACHV